jgi:hypothetical protein
MARQGSELEVRKVGLCMLKETIEKYGSALGT